MLARLIGLPLFILGALIALTAVAAGCYGMLSGAMLLSEGDVLGGSLAIAVPPGIALMVLGIATDALLVLRVANRDGAPADRPAGDPCARSDSVGPRQTAAFNPVLGRVAAEDVRTTRPRPRASAEPVTA